MSGDLWHVDYFSAIEELEVLSIKILANQEMSGLGAAFESAPK